MLYQKIVKIWTLLRDGSALSVVKLTMSVEEEETDEVNGEPETADNEHQIGIMDVLVVEHPLECLHKNGEAERNEEDRIHQGTKDFCSCPAKSIFLCVPLGYL